MTAPIRLAHERPFRLGPIEVHPATRQLVCDGRSETLEPRIMQVLVALANAEGAILTREELIERCWDGRVVGDNAVHRAISKVRDIAAIFGGGAVQLETITKVGYRMVVANGAQGGSVSAIPGAEPPPKGPALSRRQVLAAGLAGTGLAAAGTGYWWTRPDPVGEQVAALIAQSEQVMRAGMADSDVQGSGFLEEAVALQPANAEAWGRLALARFLIAEHAPPDRAAAAVAATQDAARRALSLDARQADALAALALLPPYFGDWASAERRMNAVLAIDPEHLTTRSARDYMLVGVGRAREGALDRVSYAPRHTLDALQQYPLVYTYWILGNIGEADRTADRALHLWPKHPGVWFSRLWTYAFTGRASRALAHVDDAAGRPDLPEPMIAALRASMGAMVTMRQADVTRAVDAVTGLVSTGPSHSVNAVLILAGLGEIDQAFAVAEAYLLERGPLMASVRWREGQVSVNDQRRRKTNMLFVPVTAPMRADPRFRRLVEEIGLTRYWREMRVVPDFLR